MSSQGGSKIRDPVPAKFKHVTNIVKLVRYYQGSRKCGSTGAALLGNGRPNWGNDANWKKKNKEENMERKKDKWEMRKKRWKEKEEEEGKKRKDDEDKIFLKLVE